jgi:hypothetical protein
MDLIPIVSDSRLWITLTLSQNSTLKLKISAGILTNIEHCRRIGRPLAVRISGIRKEVPHLGLGLTGIQD